MSGLKRSLVVLNTLVQLEAGRGASLDLIVSTIEKLVHREAKFEETTGTVALFYKRSPKK